MSVSSRGFARAIAVAERLSDDSRMLRFHWATGDHPLPIWAALLIVLAFCLGGCASRPDPAASVEAESLLSLIAISYGASILAFRLASLIW